MEINKRILIELKRPGKDKERVEGIIRVDVWEEGALVIEPPTQVYKVKFYRERGVFGMSSIPDEKTPHFTVWERNSISMAVSAYFEGGGTKDISVVLWEVGVEKAFYLSRDNTPVRKAVTNKQGQMLVYYEKEDAKKKQKRMQGTIVKEGTFFVSDL